MFEKSIVQRVINNELGTTPFGMRGGAKCGQSGNRFYILCSVYPINDNYLKYCSAVTLDLQNVQAGLFVPKPVTLYL